MKISFSKQTKGPSKQLYEGVITPLSVCMQKKDLWMIRKPAEDIVSDVFTSLWDKLDTDSFDLQSETALGYIKMC